MKRFKLLVLVASIVGATFTGCTCEQLIRRAESRCGKIERIDTVKTSITTTLTVRDTLLKITHYNQRDTVIVHKDNLVYKYFYNTKDSTIYLKGECNPQKIYIKIPYTKMEVIYNVWHEYRRYIIWFIFIIAFVFVVKFILTIFKPKM